jgi:head-tail adaptor
MGLFSARDQEQLIADIKSSMGDQTGIGFTASVNDALGNEAVAELLCQDIRPMDGQAKERAGMATVAKAFRVHAEYNSSVQIRSRLIVDDIDYRIHQVVPTPANDPWFMTLFIEEEPS